METIESIERTGQVVAELPIDVVKHVLWHSGELNLGVTGGSFVETLLVAISRADEQNRVKLSREYDDYVTAWRLSRQDWSHELLRKRVKDERDSLEWSPTLNADSLADPIKAAHELSAALSKAGF